MIAYELTPSEVAALRRLSLDTDSIDRHVAWRGHDDLYVAQLRAALGLPADLHEIAVARFPDGGLIISVSGASDTLCLLFALASDDSGLRVSSLFISLTETSPRPLRPCSVDAIVRATDAMLFRHLTPPQGGVQ